METKDFKLKNRALLLALAGGALSLTQAVQAAPVSASFDMTCPFPLIGEKVIGVQVDSDIPTALPIDEESGEFPISVISTIGGDAALGLDLVQAKSLDGTAVSYVTIASDSGADPRAIEVPISLETTASNPNGFELPGSGASPSLVPVESEVGTATITIAGIDLDISTYLADGSPAPAPLGNFQSTCVLPEGGVELAQLEIVAPPPPAEPEIAVSSTAIDFGSVEMGADANAVVSIENMGAGELIVDAVSIDGDAAFTVSGDCSVIASDSSCDLTVNMNTSTEGSLNATLNIASNDTDEPTTAIALSGEVAAAIVPTAVLTVDASELDLGSVQLGDSASGSVTVSNTGDADLTVTGVSSDNPDFTAGSDCGVVLAGESCGVFVEFNPSAAGAATATIVVESDAGSVPVTLSASAESDVVPPITPPPVTPPPVTPPPVDSLSGQLLGAAMMPSIDGNIPLTGTFMIEGGAASYSASVSLDPTQATINAISFLPVVAKLDFGESAPLLTSAEEGVFTASASVDVSMPKILVKLFGFLKIPLGGGAECGTVEPVAIDLTGAAPVSGEVTQLEGDFTLGPVEQCGWLTPAISSLVGDAPAAVILEVTTD